MLSRIYSRTDRNTMLLMTAPVIENRTHGAKTLRILIRRYGANGIRVPSKGDLVTARAWHHRADNSVRPRHHPSEVCGVA